MKKTFRAALAVVIAGSVGLGGVTACSSPGEDHQHHEGTDDHMVDPYKQDAGVVAQGVTRVLLTWNPAQQSSPLDVPEGLKKQTTGDLRAMLDNPSPDQVKEWTPQQWSDWSRSGAQVLGFAETPSTEMREQTATVTMGFSQRLSYPDGSRSPWKRGTATATAEKMGGEWKVSTLRLSPKDKE